MSAVNAATNQYAYWCPDCKLLIPEEYEGHEYECLSEAGMRNLSNKLLEMTDRLRKCCEISYQSVKRVEEADELVKSLMRRNSEICEINEQRITSYEKRIEEAEELVKSLMRRYSEIEKQYITNDFEERLKEERIKLVEEIRIGLGERREMNELLQSSSSSSSRVLRSCNPVVPIVQTKARRIEETTSSQSKKPKSCRNKN
jgi:hypothetical protein